MAANVPAKRIGVVGWGYFDNRAGGEMPSTMNGKELVWLPVLSPT